MTQYRLVKSSTYNPRLDKNYSTIYIIAEFSDRELYLNFLQRSKVLLKQEDPFNCPHMTLFSFLIHNNNLQHIDDNFAKKVKEIYNLYLSKQKLISPAGVTSSAGNYDVLGRPDGPKYFVRRYDAEDRSAISRFRTDVYNYLQTKMGNWTVNDYVTDKNDSFKVFVQGKNKLMYVPSIYYGSDNWEPHISIVNQFDIQNNNRDLFNRINNQENKYILAELYAPIWNAYLNPLPKDLEMSKLSKIKISIKTGKVTKEFIK